MVASGYLASTAASTFCLVVPVSGVSAAWSPGPPRPSMGAAYGLPDDALGEGLGELAALAASVPATTAPAIAPAASSVVGRAAFLMLSVTIICSLSVPVGRWHQVRARTCQLAGSSPGGSCRPGEQ